jgi:hypothetical protein
MKRAIIMEDKDWSEFLYVDGVLVDIDMDDRFSILKAAEEYGLMLDDFAEVILSDEDDEFFADELPENFSDFKTNYFPDEG